MKKKLLNNKGFSLVELLAVIVIIGILGIISIVGVNLVLDRAEKNHYTTQEKNMIMAAKSYSQDNRNVLPKNVGDTRVVTLEELQSRKYIGQVVDRSKNECTTGSVTIFKYSDNDYSYRPYLKCQKYETSKTANGGNDYGGSGPEIKLTINGNYANPSFTYKITTTGDAKIISYSYSIYKHGVLVRDSGNISVSRVSTVDDKTISLKDLVPGEFEIIFKATDIYGNTSTKTVSQSIVQEDGPECGVIEPDLRGWQNTETVTVTVRCIDRSGAGCAREVFSQIFEAESKTNYIEISDNLGNKTACEVNTYVDRTPPSKPVITNPYENTWINKSYSIKVSSMDVTSGIEYFEYRYPESVVPEERNWVRYANSNKNPGDSSVFTTPAFSKERSEPVEVRACDYAGNCSDPTRSVIKIDKTAPSCTITRNIATPNGKNNWYISKVGLTMSYNDVIGSATTSVKSPISYELTTSSTPVYAAMNLYSEQGNTTGVTWKGYIRDEAGNTSSCTDSVLKVDTEAPAKPTITNTNSTKWVKANYNINIKSKDVHSGLSSMQYSLDNSNWTNIASSNAAANTDKTVSQTMSTEGAYTYYARACDNAGNCSASSNTTVYIDKTKPTCSITKTGTGGTNNIYTSNVSLKLNVVNTGAGSKSKVSFGLLNNRSVTYNGKTTGTQGATSGITWYGFVKDEAGNTSTCNTGKFQVLLKPPVITFSLSGDKSTATCKDGNTGAAITIASGATKTLTSTDLTHTVTCTNASGQSTKSSYTYKVTSSYVCTNTCQSCDTCHGSNCGGCCGTGGHPCSYPCNCHDECCGGYTQYTYSK